MLISIIVPCFNCESTIEKCIVSILQQEYGKIEIIAVDDGSTDKTFEVLKKLEKQDSRIHVLHKENKGPSSARNLGIQCALGEYIAFVDSDDYVDRKIYVKLTEYAKKFHSDIIMCNYCEVYHDRIVQVQNKSLKNHYFSTEEIINGVIRLYYGGDDSGLAAVWNKIYKRELIMSRGLVFDELLYRGEDWWFNIKLYESATSMSVESDCLYYYFQENPNSLMKGLDARYYDEWKESKRYLMKKNEKYKFKIDKNSYYTELLFNVHSLLIEMASRKESLDYIIGDSFYDFIIQYDKNTSKVVKVCHYAHKISPRVEKGIYYLCSKVYRKIR